MATIDEDYHQIVQAKNGFALTIEELIKLHDYQYSENEKWRRNSAVDRNVAVHHGKLASNARLEKDLLELLNIVCHNGVLNDIDEQKQREFDKAWNERMKKHKESKTSVEYVVQDAIETHKYTFKRFQLKKWLEITSDQFIEDTSIPSGGHWSNTLKKLKYSTSTIAGMHPDAQYMQGTKSLADLEDNDSYQQKCLMRSIWQGIRAGKVADVIEMCKKHKLFWLAASLRGIELDNLHLFRYLDTCYKYSNALIKDNSNEVTKYEREIYAFLCNNIDALESLRGNQEDYLQHWRDWMWIVVKADYEYDIWNKIYDYRKELATFSSLYPESGHLKEASDFIDKLQRQLKSVHKHTGVIRCNGNDEVNIKDVYACLSDFVPAESSPFEQFILRLQVSLMRGYKGLKAFITGDITTFLNTPQSFEDSERLKRIVCHMLLFLRENTTSGCNKLADLVSNDLLYKSIEVYIDHLIANRLYHLVPTYGKYLSKPRRTSVFVQLLVSMQRDVQLRSQDFMDHKLSAKAEEVVSAVQRVLDDPQELVEIKKRVVETIKEGGDSSGTAAVPAASPMPSRVAEGESITPVRAQIPITPLSTGLRSRLAGGDTPFIKSSAMKSKRGGDLDTSMDVADTAIGNHESQRITSLHWLLQKDGRPEIGLLNKLEACKQANSMIISFLADDLRDLYTDNSVDFKNKLDVVKTTLIELLVTVKKNYCPEERGSESDEGVDTVPLDYMLMSCQSMIPVMGNQFESLRWNISMLKFWSRYYSIMNDLSEVSNTDETNRDAYVQALLEAISSSLNPAPGYDEDGITVIWSKCRNSFIQLFVDIVDEITGNFSSNSPGGAFYHAISGKHMEVLEAQRVVTSYYPPSTTKYTRMLQERGEKLQEYLTTPTALARRETNDILTLLENCRLILNHIHKCDEIINLVVNSLLTEYLLLCMSEGSRNSHLAVMDVDPTYKVSLAVAYYERAAELSIVLASEGIGGPFRMEHGMHELQLFNRLSAIHLEYLVKCMNNSSIEANRLRNLFNI